MFGALLGTLKRFKNDEAKQKDKVKLLQLSVCKYVLLKTLAPKHNVVRN